MRKIIYTSVETAPFGHDRLVALLEQSRARNTAEELSGVLAYAGGSFLQLLEGPAGAVGAAYDRIAADPRHRDLRLLADETVTARRFPDWAMRFEAVDDRGLAHALPGYRVSRFPLADPATIADAAVAEALLAVHRGGA